MQARRVLNFREETRLSRRRKTRHKITAAYIYRKKKIAGGAYKQDHFESTDDIMKYRRLIFDVFAATTAGFGKMKGEEKEFSYINYMHHGTRG